MSRSATIGSGLVLLLRIALGLAVSWLPRRTWPYGVFVAASITGGLPWLRNPDEGSAERRREVGWYWARLWAFSTYRPFSTPRRVRLQGREHIDRALAAGNGVILWAEATEDSSSSLSVKQALYEAGYAVYHLSHESHALGSHPWAKRLSFIGNHAEDRFLAERILMRGSETLGAMRTLKERLAANRLVTITVGSTGRSVVALESAGRRVQLSGTPVHLAQRAGAPLLPVFTRSGHADGTVVMVLPPLPVSPRDGPQPETALHAFLAVRRQLAIPDRYVPGARPGRRPGTEPRHR